MTKKTTNNKGTVVITLTFNETTTELREQLGTNRMILKIEILIPLAEKNRIYLIRQTSNKYRK